MGFLSLLSLWISITFFVFHLPSSSARHHFHKPKTSHTGILNYVSLAPAEGPTTGNNDSNISQAPAEVPTISNNDSNISQAPAEAPAEAPTTGNNDSNTDTDPAPCVFDVTSFGAVGDGESDDTEAFRSAWKEACAVESGVLLAPADGVFMIRSTIFSGPCQRGIVFQIDGKLMPPNGPDCWPETDSKQQWIVFYRADGMTLRGSGTIEGNGEEWWNLPCKPHRGPNGTTLPGSCQSPALIRFFISQNITVRDLSIQNSPQFHFKFDGCEGVLIHRLTINSPALSPNTDGIHIENTKNVGIYNSVISNGDDCISIGTGCADVDIENVTCGPSHGISIGSLGVHNSQACVTNVTVRNSIIQDSDNGVRIKTWQGGAGCVSTITFDSIYMSNVRNCIIVDQYYCLTKPCTNQSSAVYVTDVSYHNIKGTYDVRSPPIHFACSDSVPCTDIKMSDVELLPFEGEMVDDPFCWNAYGVMETLTIPPIGCLQEGEPQSVKERLSFGC